MMRTKASIRDDHFRFRKLCNLLGRRTIKFHAFRRSHSPRRNDVERLRKDLRLVRIDLRPEQILSAGLTLALLL